MNYKCPRCGAPSTFWNGASCSQCGYGQQVIARDPAFWPNEIKEKNKTHTFKHREIREEPIDFCVFPVYASGLPMASG